MLEQKRTLLVVGGRQGIGQAVANIAQNEHDDHWHDVVPVGPTTFDVREWGIVHHVAKLLRNDGTEHVDIAYCAGINALGKLGELKQDVLMEHYRVNVSGFINVLDAFKQSHGDVRVNVTAVVSDSSRVPMRGSIMYASSKAALAHAIRCAARELAPKWRVNGVSPGVVDDTPMTDMVDEVVPALRGWTLEEALAYERSLVPMGRRARKDEVADAVLWSLRGPDFMTGSIIDVTGGK